MSFRTNECLSFKNCETKKPQDKKDFQGNSNVMLITVKLKHTKNKWM